MRVRILIYLLLIILFSISVHAFGVSYEYMKNNTLELYPGQTYMFKLTVQNKNEEDVTAKIVLDSAIATLIGGPELKVPGATYDKHVFFNITIPEDAQPGDIYNINYLVSPVGRGEGQVPIAVQYDRNFKVKVVSKPKELEEEKPATVEELKKLGFSKWVFIPIIIIIILALLVLIWKKSHQISGRIIKKKPEAKITKEKIIKPYQTSLAEHKPETEPSKHHEHITHTESRVHPVKQEKILEPHHYFHLEDGRKLKDLEDMFHALKNMHEDTFNHHVSSTKNDFATWIAHSLEKQELANKLFRTTTKQEMLELIKNELEKQ